jgi:hypothetical protein
MAFAYKDGVADATTENPQWSGGFHGPNKGVTVELLLAAGAGGATPPIIARIGRGFPRGLSRARI